MIIYACNVIVHSGLYVTSLLINKLNNSNFPNASNTAYWNSSSICFNEDVQQQSLEKKLTQEDILSLYDMRYFTLHVIPYSTGAKTADC